MSKILQATADESGVVKVDGKTVSIAEVLSEGKQSSTGILIIEGDKAWYIPSSATDIKTTIDKVAQAITKIADTLTAIGTGMTGPTTAPPPALPTNVVDITLLVTELNQLKEALK